MVRRLALLGLLAAAVGGPALVPSPRHAAATHGCASAGSPAGAFDLQAYEAEDWRTLYRRTLEFAGFNQLLPELSTFALPRIETGPRPSGSSTTTTPYAPPTLLKAIAWIESSWQMAASSVDYGEIGPPLLSHSCAYGVMQIVSGMQNTNDVPTLDQVSIGSHYGFNIARGGRILAEKWNAAPNFRPIVGSRDPSLLEDWYYAVWSYHGFSFVNHPMNPIYSLGRGVYRCDGTQSFGSFPYQELVIGCLKNPPVVGGQALWSPLAVSLPSLSQPAFSQLSNWDACSQNADCAGMDIPTPTPSHTDPTTVSGSRTAAIGAPALSVSPLNVTLTALPGEQSFPVTITIANTGTGPLAWRLSPSVSWLRHSRFNGIALGTDIGSQVSKITVYASATGLAPGSYTGQIRVSSLYPNTTKIINVTFNVAKIGYVPGTSRG